jgi:hypothetical protein
VLAVDHDVVRLDICWILARDQVRDGSVIPKWTTSRLCRSAMA